MNSNLHTLFEILAGVINQDSKNELGKFILNFTYKRVITRAKILKSFWKVFSKLSHYFFHQFKNLLAMSSCDLRGIIRTIHCKPHDDTKGFKFVRLITTTTHHFFIKWNQPVNIFETLTEDFKRLFSSGDNP